MRNRQPNTKLTIIGGGIVGYFEAYFAYLDALEQNTQVKVTIHEKNASINDTTVMHLVPNLTPAEIVGVIPSGDEFLNKLDIPFDQPGGLRVDDVPKINDSPLASAFKRAVLQAGHDSARHENLLILGQKSMDFWQALFEHGDDELKSILIASHFHPCKERTKAQRELNDGYRIDLTFNYPDADKRAQQVLQEYIAMGYQDCRVLSPVEVCVMDPHLANFCADHSFIDVAGVRQWQQDAIAIWRPGGCIDTKIFLPLFHDYLSKVMGYYLDKHGYLKNCFKVNYDRHVESVVYENKNNQSHITGLTFFGSPAIKRDKQHYHVSEYVFCPGENVGTLRKLGLQEPDAVRIAGASLILRIPLTPAQCNVYENFNHYMSVFSAGVSTAWQARLVDHHIVIGMGGSKAFYGDQEPKLYDDFAVSRAVTFLNMMNEVLPDMVSIALQRPTRGVNLTMADLTALEKAGMATRWVGSRAVAYDGHPTLGAVYHDGEPIKNARCTTHLGSGGNSFAPAAVYVSRHHATVTHGVGDLTEEVLKYADSRRKM